MNFYEEAANILRVSEGFHYKAYQDSEGISTIGYGHNLESNSISIAVANHILHDDIQNTYNALLMDLNEFPTISGPRQIALICMHFQLGRSSFLKFKRFIKQVNKKNWTKAANEAYNSKWNTQTPNRVELVAQILLQNTLTPILNLN